MKSNLIYKIGIFTILCLPIVTWPPYFFQPDWAKSIIFRSITAIILFAFFWDFLGKRQTLHRGEVFKIFKKTPILWAMAALFITFFLASIFSVDPLFSFWGSPYRGGGFVTFAFMFIFAILASLTLKKEDYRKSFIISIFIGLGVSFIALAQFYKLPIPIFADSTRPSATLGNPITLGIYLSMLFFISLSLLISEKAKIWKIFYALSLFIFSYVILITVSRAAFLGMTFGAVIFFFAFPYKNRFLKISLAVLIALASIIVLYSNIGGNFPNFLEQNKVFSFVESRLSITKMFGDERFQAWKTFALAIKERPILGWGPENQTVGFDKFFNPSITWSPWWDRSHNIFLDKAVEAGLLGLLTYVFLLSAVFWALHKAKQKLEVQSEKILITGIQATLTSFIVAGFFSLDSIPTYILLFLIIAYTLYLSIEKNQKNETLNSKQFQIRKLKKLFLGFVFIALIIFLWQYNFVPLMENAKMNMAEQLTKSRRCDEAFQIMDDVLSRNSFLDAYSAIEYVDLTIVCNDAFNSVKNLEYLKKGFEVVKKNVEKRPLYTRFWISLANYAGSIAKQTNDSSVRSELLLQAESYINKAEKLAPKHQEIIVEKIKIELTSGNYEQMQKYAEKCLSLSDKSYNCHFYLGIAKIYLGDSDKGNKEIDIAASQNYSIKKAKWSLDIMADAFEAVRDYKNLAKVYESYISQAENIAQYHSSLAYVYSLIGEYKKAREQAMIVLKLAPEAKANVDAFLRTLPY